MHHQSEYLGFTNKERHEDCSDSFLEYDGKDDAAGHIDEHHTHPHAPAAVRRASYTTHRHRNHGHAQTAMHADGCLALPWEVNLMEGDARLRQTDRHASKAAKQVR